eukprot:13428245-Alexandrium_andersonii.AAC.1
MMWPFDVVESLIGGRFEEDDEIKCRLQSNLLRGTMWHTDYSGIDCVRESAELVVQALQRKYNWTFNFPPLYFARSCDVGAQQTAVL